MRITLEILERKRDEIQGDESSALQGVASAQDRLAARLATGDFVEQDLQGALYWYCEAVKQGYTYSKYNLGTMLLKGEGGIAPNIPIAKQLIEEAAMAGDINACDFLSICFKCGSYGMPVNSSDAAIWRDKSKSADEPVYFTRLRNIPKELGVNIVRPNIKMKLPQVDG